MKSFFTELFEYNHHVNQKIFEVIERNETSVPERLVKLSSHIINSHSVWNSRIDASKNSFAPWDLHPANRLIELDKSNFGTSLAIVDQYDPDAFIDYSLSNGKRFSNSVRDILFQVINHSTYHRGQLATAFREEGLEPLLSEWIVYKW